MDTFNPRQLFKNSLIALGFAVLSQQSTTAHLLAMYQSGLPDGTAWFLANFLFGLPPYFLVGALMLLLWTAQTPHPRCFERFLTQQEYRSFFFTGGIVLTVLMACIMITDHRPWLSGMAVFASFYTLLLIGIRLYRAKGRLQTQL